MNAQTVGLVAEREIKLRIRSKAYVISTVILVIGVAGISDEKLADLLRPISLEDRFLQPEDSDRAVRIATATVGVVLLFLAIQNYGNMVLMGVIEEKSSRVVEVLLNHVRPRHLLAGKVL